MNLILSKWEDEVKDKSLVDPLMDSFNHKSYLTKMNTQPSC